MGVLPAFFMAGCMVLTSCSTDDNIAVDDVDTTIGVKLNNFTVPLGQSENIKLGDILDLKEDDCVRTTANGDYEFFKEGDDVKETNPSVDAVQFKHPSTQTFDFSFSPTGGSRSLNSLRAPGDYEFGPYPINAFKFSNEEPINEVVSLTHAVTSSEIKLKLEFKTVALFANKVSLFIEFPDFLELELLKSTLPDYMGENDAKLENNTLTLNDIKTNATIDGLTLNLVGIKNFKTTKPASGNYVVVNPSEISMSGEVQMTMSVKAEDIKTLELSTNYSMTASVSFANDITLTEATGYFDPKIDLKDIGDIKIGDDVPDFLKDEDGDGDVNLILSNPNITLSVESNIDAVGVIDATLTAYYEKKGKPTETKTMTLKNIKTVPHKGDMTGKTKTVIYICRKAEGAPAGATVVVKDGTDGDLDIAELLRQIPDRITFKCDASADKTYLGTVKLGTNTGSAGYRIKPSYSFGAPLALEPTSKIVYEEKTDGFYDDIKDNDIDFRGESNLQITGKITNMTPLELVFESTAVDVNGNEISGIKLTSSNQIKSNLDGSAASTLSIALKKDANINLKDVKFDGIKFKAHATSVKAETLNKNTHTVKLDDLKVSINSEVSIDADSKKDK